MPSLFQISSFASSLLTLCFPQQPLTQFFNDLPALVRRNECGPVLLSRLRRGLEFCLCLQSLSSQVLHVSLPQSQRIDIQLPQPGQQRQLRTLLLLLSIKFLHAARNGLFVQRGDRQL